MRWSDHVPSECFVGGDTDRLYVREIGEGSPVIVVHGGPDFDHEYLLPDMDRLAERFRLVYYDQRGRGRSFSGQHPDSITLESEIADLDRIRTWLGLPSVVVLGHSWGGVLAMEYAVRHPNRVAHLILLNTAPASHADSLRVGRAVRQRQSREQTEQLMMLVSEPAYLSGDPDADLARYRVQFASALHDRAQLERLLVRFRSNFTTAGVLAARAIERRLYEQTWNQDGYHLLPQLRHLTTPALIIHGDEDFIPVDVARRIADAIPNARLVVLPCGHFSYLEQPAQVTASIEEALMPTAHRPSGRDE